jgi:hypothetical protein
MAVILARVGMRMVNAMLTIDSADAKESSQMLVAAEGFEPPTKGL